MLYILKKPPKEDLTSDPSLSSIPWYPQVQWETTPTSTEDDRANCILSVTTKVPAARLDTIQRDPALRRLPTPCQEQADVLRLIGTELHEHQSTMRGLKDLHLAQNRECTSASAEETHEERATRGYVVSRRRAGLCQTVLSPEKRLTVPESERYLVCQLHSAATRDAHTTVYDRHAPAIPTRNPVQSA